MVSRRLFTTIYVAVTMSSLLLLTIVTANYLQFFPALLSMQAAPENQGIIIDPHTNMIQVQLNLRVSNPSGYSGLRVQWVNLQLYFTAMNTSLFQNFTLFSPNTINAAIGPGDTIHIRAAFLLTEDQSKAFVPFYNKYGAVLVSHYSVDVHLITFLEASTGIDVFRDIQYPV